MGRVSTIPLIFRSIGLSTRTIREHFGVFRGYTQGIHGQSRTQLSHLPFKTLDRVTVSLGIVQAPGDVTLLIVLSPVCTGVDGHWDMFF